jgi:hypothetical protein
MQDSRDHEYPCAVITDDVHIPTQAVELLRDGLRSRIALAAQSVSSAEGKSDAREHPERYHGPLRYIDSLRGLLEEIGWSTPPSGARVDLRLHGWALVEALQDQLSVHADMLSELDEDDDEQRHAIARDLGALTYLALDVLLRARAHALRPGA